MNILFVCTGNTCRSPLAEVIFNSKCDLTEMKADSAGISVVPNSVCSSNSSFLVSKKFAIDIEQRNARQLTNEMLENFDLILTMTSYMRDVIIIKFPQFNNKVFSLLQYVDMEGDILDPFGGTIEIYESTFSQLEKVIDLLLAKLKGDKGIK